MARGDNTVWRQEARTAPGRASRYAGPSTSIIALASMKIPAHDWPGNPSATGAALQAAAPDPRRHIRDKTPADG